MERNGFVCLFVWLVFVMFFFKLVNSLIVPFRDLGNKVSKSFNVSTANINNITRDRQTDR